MIRPGYLRWKKNLELRSVESTAQSAASVATSATQQSEALAAASGAVNAPTYDLVPYPIGAAITLSCTTPASSIQYQINGGGYGAYTATFFADEGDTVEAYATATGLTDSGVITIEV